MKGAQSKRWSKLVALLGLGLLVGGCGVGFDSAAKLEGVRVLGVKKSSPYARPGQSVELRMLHHDEAEAPRPLQIMWLQGCTNPPGDLVQLCLEVFGAALKQARNVPPPPRGEPTEAELAALIVALEESFGGAAPEDESPGSLPPEAAAGLGRFAYGFGETFQLEVAEDVISSRPPPANPKVPPYGVEYVFSAVCAGQLWLDPDREGFPIGCFDEDGRPVAADCYVVGYSKVWVYDELTNDNPRILGIEVRGKRLADDDVCIDEQCETLGPSDDDGVDCPRSRTLAPCEDEDEPQSCPKLPFRVVVDEDSVNDDGVLSELEGSPVPEQMWVNYYTDGGGFASDVVLVNDSTAGFHEDTGTDFLAPEEPGVSHVWAVVHDNRGGVSWARFPVCIED